MHPFFLKKTNIILFLLKLYIYLHIEIKQSINLKFKTMENANNKEIRKAELFEKATSKDVLEHLENKLQELVSLQINLKSVIDKQQLNVESCELSDHLTKIAWKSFKLDTFGKAKPYYHESTDTVIMTLRFGFAYTNWSGGSNFTEIGTATITEKDQYWHISLLSEFISNIKTV